MKLTHEEMLVAMKTDDARYDGAFYVCVLSTKIYCLPSCKAKDPLPRNVVFHPTREAAIAAGFRGCLRCRSEFFPDVSPPWFHGVVRFMQNALGEKITERGLVEAAGVDSSTVRRYFRMHMQTTPMAYHRKLRLDHAKELLERGEDYLTAAYECGFGSASGFRDAFTKQFGMPPGKVHENERHHVQYH
jgi:methylphosphotriester-DNA--protein-cysteine methyltransferase